MTSGHSSAFGALLRRYRTMEGLTQAELAERAGISVRGLMALENGERRRPRRDTLRLLTEALPLDDDARAEFEAAARGRINLPVPVGRTYAADPPQKPLVGRAAELELLEWHLAGLGPPLLVFGGEPGIGKTRLLRQAAEMAGRRGQAVVAGGCQRRSGQEPYAPFPRAIARQLATLPEPARRELVRESRWLVHLLPELSSLLPEPISSSLEASQERRLLFDAVARSLANVAHETGIALLLDDLQWAPADALDLLTALIHDPASAHLRVVCAFRTTEVHPSEPLGLMLADLAHAGLAAQHMVEPLSPEESEQLLVSLADDLDPQSTLLRRAVRRTGGVPFYLVSYAQELRTNGAAPKRDVPWDVAHSVRQRAAVLPQSSQEILAVAAVAGRVILQSVLEQVVAWTDTDLLSALEAACEARLLEEAGGRAYQFPHDVIREALEADLGRARRTLLHRKLGEALEQQPEQARLGRAAELAWHFLEGDDPERALWHSLIAGNEAARAFAHEEAERHYRTALKLARENDDRSMQIEALQQLGATMCSVGRLEEALVVLEDATAHCQTAGDVAAEARAIAEIGRVRERRGAIGEGIARLEPLLERFELMEGADRPHLMALAELLLALGDLYYEAGRYPEELDAAERAVELGRLLRENRLITDGERQKGLALLSLGRREEARGVWAAALPLMEATRDLYNLSHTLNNLAIVCSDSQQAAEYVDRALAVAERLGDPSQIAFMTCNVAYQDYSAGRWQEARSLAERSWELSGPRGLLVSGYAALLLATIDLAEGKVEGRRWLDTCVAITTDSDMQGTRLVQQLLAEQDLLEDRPDLALTRLRPLMDRPGLEEEGVTVLLPTLARTYLELGDSKRSEAIAQDGLRRATLLGYQEVVVELLLVQGAIAARNGRWENAETAFEEALTVARSRSCAYAEGRALYEYGLMENHRGYPERAGQLLEAALHVFRRIGARPYRERTEAALGAVARCRRGA
ncbi:MAG TPA: AAA family ATPase [Chloroflexota bacterium]|nr:AAA family ATPase [Chloroflexota bacterium]